MLIFVSFMYQVLGVAYIKRKGCGLKVCSDCVALTPVTTTRHSSLGWCFRRMRRLRKLRARKMETGALNARSHYPSPSPPVETIGDVLYAMKRTPRYVCLNGPP